MKKYIYVILYLNIYTLFYGNVFAQQITLEVEAKNPTNTQTVDSLLINKTFKDYSSLEKETAKLLNKLQKVGYLEARLIEIIKQNDSLYRSAFFVGDKTTNVKLIFNSEEFNSNDFKKANTKSNKNYFIISFEDLEPTLEKLTKQKTENGDAFAKIYLSNIRKENNILVANLNLASNPQRNIDGIVVKGYEKFPVSFIKHYAGIKKGIVFNSESIIKKNDALNALGFVTSMKPPETLFKKDSTIVYLYLKKQNNNLFDGIIGFNTDEETNRLQFNGYLNLELNNNLNFGEQLLINYKSDGNEQVNFRSRLRTPYLFKSPIGLELQLQIFKRDSTFITTDQQAKLSYQISPSIKTFAGYKSYDSSSLTDAATIGNNIEDYTSKYGTIGFEYLKSGNNFFSPIKSFLNIEAEIGTRENQKQTRAKLEAFTNIKFNSKNIFFIRNETAALFSDDFFTNELYRFGGINSIRGFNENSIDASVFSVINTEYRLFLNPSIYIHSIIDLAYFENKVTEIKENLYGLGFGFGLNTKAGVLKIALANGLQKNQDFRLSNSKIHISLNAKF